MTVRVYPGAKHPTHEISLSDGVKKWGLRLDGGAAAIQEVPMTASTLQFSGGGTKFGDWEPGMSHIEQRTWEGGRGQEDYIDDPTRFYDSMNAWTLNSGKIFPAPQWKISSGYRQSYQHLPGNVDWLPLIGVQRWLSASFMVGDEVFQLGKVYLWLKRSGSPGPVNLAVYTDVDDQPGLLVDGSQTALDTGTITDVVSRFAGFDLSGCQNLEANTRYHLVVWAAETDGAANHWLVGIDKTTDHSLRSTDGSVWEVTDFSLYHRAVDLDIERKWHLFSYMQGLYAVDQHADGTPSRLFLNGDRGLTSQATVSSLTDSDKNWTADEWVGAWVTISTGTGAGQRKAILGNTDNTLAVSGWEIVADATSEYVIFNTAKWRDISPQSGDLIDGAVQQAVVVDEEVLLAQGMSLPIMRMRWNPNAAPPAHEFADDGINKADRLLPRVDTVNGLQLWRVKSEKSRVSKAAIADWGTPYSYENDILIGFKSDAIINLYEHNGDLYVFKTDGRYQIYSNGTVEKTLGDIGFIPSNNNGEALLSKGLFVYFSWGGFSLQRLYDSGYSCELSSVGPDTAGGLPEERRGRVAALVGHPDGIIAAVDAGQNRHSSVVMRLERSHGWHEVFRGWEAGARVGNLFWQQIGECRPRLWISVGGELVYQEWPEGGFDPLKDPGMRYQHETVLETSTIDMGAARLPKFIKEFTALSENLGAGIQVDLDYQIDDAVGSNDWQWAGTYYTSPEDVLPIRQGEARRIRLRLRMVTNQNSIPPVVQATVLEGYARTPLKYQWNMRVKLGDCQPDLTGIGPDHDADEFLAWLKAAAVNARAITMRSIWEPLDGKCVIIEPPSLLRAFANNLLGVWGGSINLTLRES